MPFATALALILTIVFWASAFPGIRAALEVYSPAHLGFFRFTIASVVLAAAWLRRRPPLPRREDLPGLFVLGGVGIAIYNVALNTGSLTVSSGTAGLLVNTAPIWTAAMAAVSLRERSTWNVWAGLIVAFAGAAIIALRNGGPLGLSHGALLVLGASLCHAVYITLQKRYVATYGPIGITCYAVWIGTAFLALGSSGLVAAVQAAPLKATVTVVYLGVVPAALAYLSWAYVLARFPASRAVGFLFFVPVGAFLIGWLWLGEIPTGRTAVGAALVLAGVVLVNRPRNTVVRLLYDGRCGMCRQTMEMVRRLDWFGRVAPMSLESTEAMTIGRDLGILPADTRRELHLITADNDVLRGFYAMRRLFWALPLLTLLAPLLYVPGVSFLGRRAYALVARRRHRDLE